VSRLVSLPTLAAALAGAATVFGFAPFGAPLVPPVALALLLLLWGDAPTARAAARLGFVFGLALFGAGVSWVYVAISTFGGMPAPLAAIGTAGFVAYLALYPAAAGFVAARFTAPRSGRRALAGAAAWTVAEWLRSWVLSGFGWLSLGYSQLPGSPLAGYAPIGGTFAVTLAAALCAAAFALAADAFAVSARRGGAFLAAAGAVAAGGHFAGMTAWTIEVGAPVSVSLVQGNVLQDLKFDPGFRDRTFELYTRLARDARGRLTVLPESALPVFADEVPDAVLQDLARSAAARDGDVLVGLFTLEPPVAAGGPPRYYKSVVSLGAAEPQLYRKRHLVPFGETIPLESVLGPAIRALLAIPLASQSRGDAEPPPLAVAGQRVAVNICYEDAFGADIRSQAERATLLVNVTNDAWYGRSLAAEQHAQIARMRALETGRPMLRATNTGITSAIAHDGREIGRLPWFVAGILEVEVAGRQGATPYVRFGDAPAAILSFALLAVALGWSRRGQANG
jgi:apolipoprotein N-acyltransferase